jgi:hypothetical protein
MKKKSFKHMAPGAPVVELDPAALAAARGGLVSNFNRVTRDSDYNPDGSPRHEVVPNHGPLESW